MRMIAKVEIINLVVSNLEPIFDISTVALKDRIDFFLIMDIVLISYKGDHVLCESHPLILCV
mgnify:CR=1 FL=1